MTRRGRKVPKGCFYIYRASKTLPDGSKIYARDYGKRAFKILICPGGRRR